MTLIAGALTTLATVKTELSITASTDDDFLEHAINGASDFITSYCRRVFHYEAGIAEKVPGYGGNRLAVSRTPLLTITSITLDGGTISTDDYEIDGDGSTGFIYSQAGWAWTTNRIDSIGAERIPGRERRLYTVTYTGGYVTPNQTGTRTLPYDLESACTALVVQKYRQRGRDPSVKSVRLMEAAQTYAATSGSTGTDPLQATNPWVYSVLAKYKRWDSEGL